MSAERRLYPQTMICDPSNINNFRIFLPRLFSPQVTYPNVVSDTAANAATITDFTPSYCSSNFPEDFSSLKIFRQCISSLCHILSTECAVNKICHGYATCIHYIGRFFFPPQRSSNTSMGKCSEYLQRSSLFFGRIFYSYG